MSELNLNHFKPIPTLLSKYRAWAVTIALFAWLIPVGFTTFVVLIDEQEHFPRIPLAVGKWFGIVILPILFLIIWLLKYYYLSIEFEILQDEIHVNRGIITKSRKIVPFRTITNIDIRRGPYDRVYGIGSIEIQTAGYSANKSGPEERLDGVPSSLLEEIQREIINRVRKVKGSPATSHDLDTPDDIFSAILIEIKTLRKLLTDKFEK
ncbi:MAG: PH domain-containing protein [Candidatus Heimdallarchaeota archaeon]|nr:PH domain-containing protein [Candidatus Heimdallarchaeota archaeon]